MKKIALFILAAFIISGSGCNTNDNTDQSSDQFISVGDGGSGTIAFFYQTVGLFMNGSGENAVRVGTTSDGKNVDSYNPDDSGNVLDWTQGANHNYSYGDPVYSRLADGTWTMTARSSNQDPRGGQYLLYAESDCPLVNDETVIAIGPSSASGCKPNQAFTQGKTSQVFTDDEGRNLLFHMSGAEIYLTYLSDATHSVTDLTEVCMIDEPINSLSELDYGSSALVINRDQANGLLLSDTAIARRSDIDGTWVLFVKGIEQTSGCEMGSLCELCGRSIYRTTSTDLVHWSDLEKVVEQGSIPEAVTTPDGSVWLYWQDFSNACAAEDLKLSAQAPIAGAYEQADSNKLSDKVIVSFPDEAFESDAKLHYATNGNPVTLPDEQALTDLTACLL